MDNKRIMVVDDDKNICQLLELYLTNEGYDLCFAYDGSSALDKFRECNPSIILLDIMLPVINGWEVCKIIRKTSNIPIIMITSRDLLEDKVQGFELGADDYIVKPFEPKEVVARVKAKLKNINNIIKVTSPEAEKNVIKSGNLTVDMNKYEVKSDIGSIELKPKEIQLLHFLLQNKNIVFSREQLLEKVWDYSFMGDTRTVDVHIKRLREKLEEKDASVSIKTIWGVGYKLELK